MVEADLLITPGDTEWFIKNRFGMFIHFGLYSMAARHEWVKTYEKTPEEKYNLYFKYFNPDLYNASEWAKIAKKAGMKYVILTTKHHEGFCLWDTVFTDYKATNTPAGRDLIAEYVEALRAEGLKVGFYYSLIDWHHPDFTLDVFHPLNRHKDAHELNKGRSMERYCEYMRNQVSELLTNYGKIDLLYFDNSYPGEAPMEWADEIHPRAYSPEFGGKGKDDWEAEKLIETARELQPHLIINDRTLLEQDIHTRAEQMRLRDWPTQPDTGKKYIWETWQTFGGSWGYYRDECTWMSVDMILSMFINSVSYGGNFLLNVGPTSRGKIDERSVSLLEEIGNWMYYNGRSIYNCTMSEFKAPESCRFTQNGRNLYMHFLIWPVPDIGWPLYEFLLEGMAGKVEYAQFLHDGSEIKLREIGNDLYLNIPPVKPKVIIPVIEMFLK